MKYLKPAFISTLIFGLIIFVSFFNAQATYADTIALDTSTAGTDFSGSSPDTLTFVTGSGTNRYLAVTLAVMNPTNQPTATSCTYNGVSMNEVESAQEAPASGNLMEVSTWFLSAPTSGSNSISCAYNHDIGGHAVIIASSYTGASQTNSADAVNRAVGTASGSQSASVTVVANNSWIVAGAISTATGITQPTITANQTSRGNVNLVGTKKAAGASEDTNGTVSAGSNTIGYTFGATSGYAGFAISAASFAPATTAAIVNNGMVQIKSQVYIKTQTYVQ